MCHVHSTYTCVPCSFNVHMCVMFIQRTHVRHVHSTYTCVPCSFNVHMCAMFIQRTHVCHVHCFIIPFLADTLHAPPPLCTYAMIPTGHSSWRCSFMVLHQFIHQFARQSRCTRVGGRFGRTIAVSHVEAELGVRVRM